MPGKKALPGEIGNFVLPEPVGLENFHGGQVHIRLRVVVGQLQEVLIAVHGGVRLDFQAVAAHVLRVDGQNVLQGLFPVRQGLTRQAVHQVQRQILEARLPDALDGRQNLGIIMGTAQLFQHFVVVVLDPQAHPVEALSPEPPEQLVGDGIRVGFKGNFRIAGHVEIFPHGGKNGRQAVAPQIAGGAAAEVHGIDLVAGGQLSRLFDMGADGVDVGVHPLVVLAGQGIEIAILALAAAKGDMHINAKGYFFFSTK